MLCLCTSVTDGLQTAARPASSPTGAPTAFQEEKLHGTNAPNPRSRVTNTVTNNIGLTIFRDSAPPRRITSHHWWGMCQLTVPREDTGQRGSEEPGTYSTQAHLCLRNIRRKTNKQTRRQTSLKAIKDDGIGKTVEKLKLPMLLLEI